MAANGSPPLCLASRRLPADAPNIRTFVIDRLTGSLKLLLMLVLAALNSFANDAVVQVDDFVGDGSYASMASETNVA